MLLRRARIMMPNTLDSLLWGSSSESQSRVSTAQSSALAPLTRRGGVGRTGPEGQGPQKPRPHENSKGQPCASGKAMKIVMPDKNLLCDGDGNRRNADSMERRPRTRTGTFLLDGGCAIPYTSGALVNIFLLISFFVSHVCVRLLARARKGALVIGHHSLASG